MLFLTKNYYTLWSVGGMDTTSDSAGRTSLIKFSAKGVGVGLVAEMKGHAGIQTTQRYMVNRVDTILGLQLLDL